MKSSTTHLLIAYLVGSFFGLMQVWGLLSGLLKPRASQG